MQDDSFPFRKILFGFAYSPSLLVNLAEATRLSRIMGARLTLLHVGPQTRKKEKQLRELLTQLAVEEDVDEILWRPGKAYPILREAVDELGIDLLMLGAKQHESLYTFYVGSIARKLTRNVSCSVLLLIRPSLERTPCKHVVVNGLEDRETPTAIRRALYMAKALGSEIVTVVEEIRPEEIDVPVEDDQSLEKAAMLREQISRREDLRVQKILDQVPDELKGPFKVKTQSVFGRRGYTIGHYAEVVRADLLVMNAPVRSNFWDRVFTHDIEFILSDLPTDTLIVRS